MADPISRPSSDERAARAGAGLNLGTLLGVRVRVDYSLLVIAALLTVNLGAGVFPAWHPDWGAPLCWLVAVVAALLFFASVLAHELAHAVVGRRLGVPMGGITLFMFGGMAHMEREPERPRAEFLMAVVGPLTSVAIGIAAMLAGAALAGEQFAGAETQVEAARSAGPLATLLLWLGPVNVFLGLFNLVPGFPLDGGRMLRALVWWLSGSYRKATNVATLAGQGVALLLVASGLFMAFGYRVPLFGSGPAQGIWLVLIGWFLSNAARASQRQALMLDALEGVPVERLMRRHFEAVEPDVPVADLVFQRLLRDGQRCYPIVRGERLEGLVCLEDVRKVPEPRWEHTQVASIMTPLSRLTTLRPTDSSAEALRLLGHHAVDQLPVVDPEGRVCGLIRRDDLLRWLALRSDRDAPGAAPTAFGGRDLERPS